MLLASKGEICNKYIFFSYIHAINYLILLFSYAFVLLNDLFTAGNGILIKQKVDTKDLGKNGLLFYNCLFMIPPAFIVFFMTEDLSRIIGDFHNEEIIILS